MRVRGILGTYRGVGFEYSPRTAQLYVIDNYGGMFSPETRIGNEYEVAVSAYLQVLQERTRRRDFREENVIVREFTGLQVEGEQARIGKSVIAMVNNPQSILPVDNNAEHGIEQVQLHRTAGIGHGRTVNPLEQAIALRPRLRVNGKKNPAFLVDGNIANRLGIADSHLQRGLRQFGWRSQVGVRLSAAVTESQYRSTDQQDHCKKKQETSQNPNQPFYRFFSDRILHERRDTVAATTQ
jgi:hypothetical protein